MRKFLGLLATGVIALVASLPARANDVTIENYSNHKMYVAAAYNHWKGNVAAEG